MGIYEDFDQHYRSREDFEEWHARDSLMMQRKRLISQGLSYADITEIESLLDERIKHSVNLAQAAPFPSHQNLYKGVFYEGN